MATPVIQGDDSEFGMGTNAAPTTVVDRTAYILNFNWGLNSNQVPVNLWGTGSFVPNLPGKRTGDLGIDFLKDEEGVMSGELHALAESRKAINYEYYPEGETAGNEVRTGTMRLISLQEANSGDGSNVKMFATTWSLQESPTIGEVPA